MTPTSALFDERGEPLEDAPIPVHPDIGCDWVRLDPRFGACQTCPLAACRLDWPEREQQSIDTIVERALRGTPPAAKPARPSQRQRWELYRALYEAVASR